jgi:hypothetical protein
MNEFTTIPFVMATVGAAPSRTFTPVPELGTTALIFDTQSSGSA